MERPRTSGSSTPAASRTIRTRRWTSRSARQVARGDRRGGPAALRRRREGRPASERLHGRRAAPRLAKAVDARRQQGRRSEPPRTSTSSTPRRRRSDSRLGAERQELGRPARRASSTGFPRACRRTRSALRVAVIGRPNVGKSSFVNRLLGEERLVVSEIAGTTRDAIDTPMTLSRPRARLRRHRRTAPPDARSTTASSSTRRCARAARSSAPTSACSLIDATEGEFHNQDLKIADTGVGSRARPDHRRQQVGPRGEGRQGGAQVREGGAREGAVPQVRAVPLHVGAHRPARHQDARPHPRGRGRARDKRITTSQVNERLARAARPPSAAAGGRSRGEAQLRDAGRDVARRRSPSSATIRISWRSTTSAYLHNGFRETWGVHGQPAAHRAAAEERHRRTAAN